MKTEYKYIRFAQREAIGTGDHMLNGRPVWEVHNKKGGNEMGQVFWDPAWKQWVARFDSDAVWSHDCLADVREFIFMMPIHSKYDVNEE